VNYAGMDEDTQNKRVDPCGCVWRFMAPPINGWVRFDRCAEHAEKP
jgi:hypothetical protein